tara:strand:+ start:428 stop:577 length:150 start_codon:yes stop_codon:yes gene_type:complete
VWQKQSTRRKKVIVLHNNAVLIEVNAKWLWQQKTIGLAGWFCWMDKRLK